MFLSAAFFPKESGNKWPSWLQISIYRGQQLRSKAKTERIIV